MMNITPLRSYTYGNYSYSQIAPPFQNTEEITMGMEKNATPDPLYVSNTVYGTNANPLTADYRYVTSAEYLARYNQINNSNCNRNLIPSVDSTVDTENNIYKNQESHLNETTDEYRETDLYRTFDYVGQNTSQFVYDHPQLGYEESLGYAAMTAGYNVNLNPNNNEILAEIRKLATTNNFKSLDMSNVVDGQVYLNGNINAALKNDRNTQELQNVSNPLVKKVLALFSPAQDRQIRSERIEKNERRPNTFQLIA